MSDSINRKIEEMSKRIDAEVAALGAIDEPTLAAVRELDTHEARLKQRLLNGEITKQEYFAQWDKLMDSTPHEVVIASIKLMEAISASLARGSGSADA